MPPSRILLLLPLLLMACEPQAELKPFSSDGCSLFPDGDLIKGTDWRDCCVQHDIAYWQGGTREQRKTADEALRQCVLEKTGNEELAKLMYEGVRFGGSPYFYNWYRWGYGWPYERKYQPLDEEEAALARRLLDDFYSNY